MRLLLATLVATFAAADLIEFGVATCASPSPPSGRPQSGKANEQQWHLLTADLLILLQTK